MRHGKSQEVRAKTPEKAVARPTFLDTMPQWKRFVFFMLCPTLGPLIFFAQGLVPLIIFVCKIIGIRLEPMAPALAQEIVHFLLG